MQKVNLPSQVFLGSKIQKLPEPKAMVSYFMRRAVNIAPLILPENKRAVRLFGCLYAVRPYASAKLSLHFRVLETKRCGCADHARRPGSATRRHWLFACNWNLLAEFAASGLLRCFIGGKMQGA
jgi:hypothetical protein